MPTTSATARTGLPGTPASAAGVFHWANPVAPAVLPPVCGRGPSARNVRRNRGVGQLRRQDNGCAQTRSARVWMPTTSPPAHGLPVAPAVLPPVCGAAKRKEIVRRNRGVDNYGRQTTVAHKLVALECGCRLPRPRRTGYAVAPGLAAGVWRGPSARKSCVATEGVGQLRGVRKLVAHNS